MIDKMLERIALANGYKDTAEMLMAYGIMPTAALRPKHTKLEFIALLLKSIKK